MSTNSANQVPPRGGAKKSTKRTLVSSMTYEDIFKAMDLNLSESVKTYIPKQGRGGNSGMVPGHIRGCSNNPMRVITEIQGFRRLGANQQKLLSDLWRDMSPNVKDEYKHRIAQLEFIRGELNLGIENWKAVTAVVEGVFVENEIDLPAPSEPPATDPASEMILTPIPGVSNAMPVTAEELTASGNEENQDPNAYVGLGSEQELRDVKEADAKHRSRHDTKRKLGTFAERVDQQNDKKAIASLHTALRAVAVACDTMHYPGLTEGQPRQTIMCIAINQVADPLPQGGRMKSSDIVRPKTQVIVAGRDKETIKWALSEFVRTSKHGESPTHELIDLHQDKESKKVQTTIDQFFEEKHQARQQPSKKPRTVQEVVAEEFEYISSPAGQQDQSNVQFRSRVGQL
jgi:hypothetical protein